jgi:hypothetical protein
MASPLQAQLLLCDAAIADDKGKVSMLGAGWSVTSSPAPPQAVAVLIKVPWDRANQKLSLKLDMLDGDGNAVQIDAGNAKIPIHGEGTIEVGRPPGVDPGSPLDAAFVLNVPPLPLEPGRYEWRLELAELEVTSSFQVR